MRCAWGLPAARPDGNGCIRTVATDDGPTSSNTTTIGSDHVAQRARSDDAARSFTVVARSHECGAVQSRSQSPPQTASRHRSRCSAVYGVRMDLRRLLGLMRMFVGVFSWIAPRSSARSFGLGDVADDARAALVARLFGGRDLVLGAAVAFARDDASLATALRLGVVVDTVDVAATAIARRRGASRWAAAIVGGGAAVLAAMGAVVLRQLDTKAPAKLA